MTAPLASTGRDRVLAVARRAWTSNGHHPRTEYARLTLEDGSLVVVPCVMLSTVRVAEFVTDVDHGLVWAHVTTFAARHCGWSVSVLAPKHLEGSIRRRLRGTGIQLQCYGLTDGRVRFSASQSC